MLSTNSWTSLNTWVTIGKLPTAGTYPARVIETFVITQGGKFISVQIDPSGDIKVCPRAATANNDLFTLVLPYI